MELAEHASALVDWLSGSDAEPAAVCRVDPPVVLDWSAGAPPQHMPDPPAIGIGRYLEDRAVYTGDAYRTDDPKERRTVHLGIDVFLPPGEPVNVPFDGIVVEVADRNQPRDYGPVVLVEHRTADDLRFFTLYGHLSRQSIGAVVPGRHLAAGELLARIGDREENGGWLPHLHLQLLTTHLDQGTALWGVAPRSQLDRWRLISPDPNLVLRIPGLAPAIELGPLPRHNGAQQRNHTDET